MKPYYESNGVTIYHGDCREVLPLLAPVYAILTDPPYELGFMGKAWDKTGIAYDSAMWRECLQVLKPGGHLLSFGGSRTYHRMACAIEDAGFEIRDQIMWLYGSGFPKSLDVSKAIDKAAGEEREVLGISPNWRESKRDREKNGSMEVRGENAGLLTGPAVTDAAKQWQGWGTALKPAHEPIVVARKPLEGTVAANVAKHGTGALNIDGCRIRVSSEDRDAAKNSTRGPIAGKGYVGDFGLQANYEPIAYDQNGRWPANVIHDGSEEVVRLFPQTASGIGAVKRATSVENGGQTGSSYESESRGAGTEMICYGDNGSAARFFYTAKADKEERERNMDSVLAPLAYGNQVKRGNLAHAGTSGINTVKMRGNNHPTVKPLDLMAYLCKLLCPPEGGILLDPFMGSGSTLIAGRRFYQQCIGIEVEERYCEIAAKRLSQEVLSFE